MNKNVWKIVSACVMVVGAIGFVALGGTEGQALGIVTLAVALVAAAVALWKAIKG